MNTRHPAVIESVVIGQIAGQDAHAWIERTTLGGDRFFKEVPVTVYGPSLGRDICLGNVVAISAKEYGQLFSVFAAA